MISSWSVPRGVEPFSAAVAAAYVHGLAGELAAESVGDWSVSTSVTPPEGFEADHDSLSEQVTNEFEAVQFVLTDVGSDWVPTQVKQVIDGEVALVQAGFGVSRVGGPKGPDVVVNPRVDRYTGVCSRTHAELPRDAVEVDGWLRCP